MLMDEVQRNDVWAKLPARLARLSIGVRVLPWVREELVDWVADAITKKRGGWSAGGAEPFFTPGIASTVERSSSAEEDVIVARTATGLFRLRIGDKLRAFAF